MCGNGLFCFVLTLLESSSRLPLAARSAAFSFSCTSFNHFTIYYFFFVFACFVINALWLCLLLLLLLLQSFYSTNVNSVENKYFYLSVAISHSLISPLAFARKLCVAISWFLGIMPLLLCLQSLFSGAL